MAAKMAAKMVGREKRHYHCPSGPAERTGRVTKSGESDKKKKSKKRCRKDEARSARWLQKRVKTIKKGEHKKSDAKRVPKSGLTGPNNRTRQAHPTAWRERSGEGLRCGVRPQLDGHKPACGSGEQGANWNLASKNNALGHQLDPDWAQFGFLRAFLKSKDVIFDPFLYSYAFFFFC